MRFFSTTSTAAATALLYITAGALTLVWTAVWYVYMRNNPPETTYPYYWCAGVAASGFILLMIGLGLGRIGRSARSADVGEVVQTSVTPGVPGTGMPSSATTTAMPAIPPTTGPVTIIPVPTLPAAAPAVPASLVPTPGVQAPAVQTTVQRTLVRADKETEASGKTG